MYFGYRQGVSHVDQVKERKPQQGGYVFWISTRCITCRSSKVKETTARRVCILDIDKVYHM